MIIVLQSLNFIRDRFKDLLGDREGVFLTSSHREALDFIRDNVPIGARLVVILSDQYANEHVNGSMIALGVKGMRPDAWCILYTAMRPSWLKGIDGVIDKMDERVNLLKIVDLIDAGIADLERFSDLDALFVAFPWIQRPAR